MNDTAINTPAAPAQAPAAPATTGRTAAANGNTSAPAPSGASSLEFKQYLQALPEPDRELYTKNGVDSFEKQTQWVRNMEGLIGKKGIIPPGENAKPEEKAKFAEQVYDILGRPKDGKYEYELPEGSDEKAYSDEFFGSLATVAHKYGMSNEGFNELVKTIAGAYNQQLSEWRTLYGELQEKLKPDTMNDLALPTTSQTHEDMHAEAVRTLNRAAEEFSKGNRKVAEELQAKARNMYANLPGKK